MGLPLNVHYLHKWHSDIIVWAFHKDDFEVPDPRGPQKLPFQSPLFGLGLLLLIHKPVPQSLEVGIPHH